MSLTAMLTYLPEKEFVIRTTDNNEIRRMKRTLHTFYQACKDTRDRLSIRIDRPPRWCRQIWCTGYDTSSYHDLVQLATAINSNMRDCDYSQVVNIRIIAIDTTKHIDCSKPQRVYNSSI